MISLRYATIILFCSLVVTAHGMKRASFIERESKKVRFCQFVIDGINNSIDKARNQESSDILNSLPHLLQPYLLNNTLQNCEKFLIERITKLEYELEDCDTDLYLRPKKSQTVEQIAHKEIAPLVRKLEVTKQLLSARANLGLVQIATLQKQIDTVPISVKTLDLTPAENNAPNKRQKRTNK